MCIKRAKSGEHMKLMKQSSGFTLIELMVVITIFALLLVMGIPSFQTFLQNRQIRNTAESILSGMQIARAEAVKSNAQHVFQLNATAGTWTVYQLSNASPPAIVNPPVQTFDFGTRWPNVRVAANGRNAVTFDGIGRMTAQNDISVTGITPALTLNPITTVNVDIASLPAGVYSMRVEAINAARGLRTCMPHLPATDPKGC